MQRGCCNRQCSAGVRSRWHFQGLQAVHPYDDGHNISDHHANNEHDGNFNSHNEPHKHENAVGDIDAYVNTDVDDHDYSHNVHNCHVDAHILYDTDLVRDHHRHSDPHYHRHNVTDYDGVSGGNFLHRKPGSGVCSVCFTTNVQNATADI